MVGQIPFVVVRGQEDHPETGAQLPHVPGGRDAIGLRHHHVQPEAIVQQRHIFGCVAAVPSLAVDELEAGNTVSAADAIPVYLRNDVAKKPKPVVL